MTFYFDIVPGALYCGHDLMVEGWCFLPGDAEPPRVVGIVTVTPLGGDADPGEPVVTYEMAARTIERPDVQAAYPADPAAQRSGFVWMFRFSRPCVADVTFLAEAAGREPQVIGRFYTTVVTPMAPAAEAMLPEPIRVVMADSAAKLTASDFELHCDAPRNGQIPPRGEFVVQGWCRRIDGQHIAALRVVVDDEVFALTSGLPRPDVFTHHAARAGTMDTGFQGPARSKAGPAEVRIEANTCGRWLLVATLDVAPINLLPFTIQTLSEALAQRWRRAHSNAGWLRGSLAVGSQLGDLVALDVLPRIFEVFQTVTYGNFQQHAPRPVRVESFPAASNERPEQLPKITIVTPSFNHAAFLRATIDSVVEQRGVRRDYLVMDGGSSDGSVEIIREYAPRLTRWISESDDGQSAAVARGLQWAECGPDDVMAYLNSDDVLMPGVLRFVAEYFRRHPQVDAVYGHRVIIDRDGAEVGRWYTPRHSDRLLTIVDLVPQETLFWRRRLYDAVGGIDPSFRFALDWDLLVRFQRAGARMTRLPYFMASFRVHADSKTVRQSTTVGAAEVERIRQRVHGRALTPREVYRQFNRAQIEAGCAAWLMARGIRW